MTAVEAGMIMMSGGGGEKEITNIFDYFLETEPLLSTALFDDYTFNFWLSPPELTDTYRFSIGSAHDTDTDTVRFFPTVTSLLSYCVYGLYKNGEVLQLNISTPTVTTASENHYDTPGYQKSWYQKNIFSNWSFDDLVFSDSSIQTRIFADVAQDYTAYNIDGTVDRHEVYYINKANISGGTLYISNGSPVCIGSIMTYTPLDKQSYFAAMSEFAKDLYDHYQDIQN